MSGLKLILFGLLLTFGMPIYEGRSPVAKLTANDFNQVYEGIWLVEFYAPWCGHCQRLAPEYEKAAKALKGIANIAAIDASNEKVNINIQGYPTIKLFVDGKTSDYNGERTANGIIDFMLKQFKKIANKRLGGGSSSSSGGSQSSGSGDQKDVIVLTQENFDQNVYGDNSAWFVQFYAPWCGHCQRLAPEWAALASNLKGEIKVAKVDATENQGLASRFGVRGYPTIKFFKPGQKDDNSAIDYEGPRSESGMADWAREQTQGLNNFQHIQLTSQSVYDQFCKGKNLCIINFLPSSLDVSQQQRKKYFQIIKETALKFKGKPFKFLWSQGGDQLEFEEKLGVSGIGYPSVVALFEMKQIYGRLKRSYSQQNLENFLNDILKNKAKFSKLYPLPLLKTVQAQNLPQGCDQHQCTGPADSQNEGDQFASEL